MKSLCNASIESATCFGTVFIVAIQTGFDVMSGLDT